MTKDKDIIIIIGMVLIVASVIMVNNYLSSREQATISSQNDRIINDVDYNRKVLTMALKEIGNASKQEAINQKLDLHIADLTQVKQMINQTNAKLDKLLVTNK